MSPRPKGPPPHAASLRQRIRNVANARGTTEERILVAICNTVIAQMLPAGVIKGGTAMKLRLGEAGSRFTPDIDTSRSTGLTLDDYQDELADNLRTGWGGFSGRLAPCGAPTRGVLAKLNDVGQRLFAARRAGQWPPKLVVWPGWDSLYVEAAAGLDVLSTVEQAAAWANDLVGAAIDAGRQRVVVADDGAPSD